MSGENKISNGENDENKNPSLSDGQQGGGSFWDEDGDDDANAAIDGTDGEESVVAVPKSKMLLIKKLLLNIRENSDRLNNLLSPFLSPADEERISIGQMADDQFKAAETEDRDGRVIEGVFDGENMVGPDGKIYSVPANYASKSKLVEGDIMKLTITSAGTFIYKQIGPIERARIVGKLEKSPDGNHAVVFEGKRWRILTASVTYFKGQPGDEVIILVPKAGESNWAAVENIIRKRE
jgi:hypothetical protein